jgi:hypothetical protein
VIEGGRGWGDRRREGLGRLEAGGGATAEARRSHRVIEDVVKTMIRKEKEGGNFFCMGPMWF